MKYKTIIISDLHLGNPFSNWKRLEIFLKENSCDDLFLNGDIVDEKFLKQNNKELLKNEIDFLNSILYSKNQNFKETYYITGNHEEVGTDVYMYRGIDYHIYTTIKGDLFYISHGHRSIFKNSITNNKNILKLVDLTIRCLAKLKKIHSGFVFQKGELNIQRGTEFSILSKVSRRVFKIGLKIISGYKRKIKIYGDKYNVQGIICGHVHQPEIKKIKGILYLNSGDWLENNSALIQDLNGNWKIKINL